MSEPVQLDLVIDRDGDLPLATQLAWKLETAIATGRATPGDRLPGVREVAEAAGVNVNTARAVYRRLENSGLIESHHGRGTFVASGAAQSAELERITAATAAAARDAGLDPHEVAAALFVAPGRDKDDDGDDDPPPGPGGRARRGALRGEIARLEAELAPLEGLRTPPRPSAPASARMRPALAELEAVRDELRERLADALAERDDAVRSVRATRRVAEADALRAAHSPAPRRVWRHGGTWTSRLAPGSPTYES